MTDATARKTAIVTGSNSGIGLGIAHALAAAGHNVVINSFTDRDEDHALARMLALWSRRRSALGLAPEDATRAKLA